MIENDLSSSAEFCFQSNQVILGAHIFSLYFKKYLRYVIVSNNCFSCREELEERIHRVKGNKVDILGEAFKSCTLTVPVMVPAWMALGWKQRRAWS